jgi:hypothetical protein
MEQRTMPGKEATEIIVRGYGEPLYVKNPELRVSGKGDGGKAGST